MKKYSFLLFGLMIVASTTSVMAQGRGDMDRVQNPETHVEMVSDSDDSSARAEAKSEYVGNGEQVQVYNQVKVSNQGEEKNLQVNTMEQTGTESAMMGNANQRAIQSMNEVAQKAQQLIQDRGTSQGIGQTLNQFAQDQQNSQAKVEQAFNQLDRRTGLGRLLWGTDQQAVSTLRDEASMIDTRIQHLEEAKLDLPAADQATIDEMIMQLEDQKLALTEEVSQEETSTGVLGFFRNLFRRGN